MAEISSLKISDDEVDHFAQNISAAWYRAAESVIEAAVSLRRAQDVLGKKQFTALRAVLENRRVMSSSTVSKLLVIAQNPTLTAPENIPLLPAPTRRCMTLLARIRQRFRTDLLPEY